MRNLIALGHYSRTGKDTLAQMLQHHLGGPDTVKIVSFASPLKQVCYELFAWAGMQDESYYNTPEGAPLRDVILPKLGLTPVQLWVKFGTDLVRWQIHDDTWINLAMHRIDAHLANKTHWCIITDLRFPNEAETIYRADGVLVKLTRPGVIPRSTSADTALLDFKTWDFILGNNGTLEELSVAGRKLLSRLPEASSENILINARDEATPFLAA